MIACFKQATETRMTLWSVLDIGKQRFHGTHASGIDRGKPTIFRLAVGTSTLNSLLPASVRRNLKNAKTLEFLMNGEHRTVRMGTSE